jgi:hypothetical protein
MRMAARGGNTSVSERKYASSGREYASPGREYAGSEREYAIPERKYASPGREYASPGREYAIPERNYASPGREYASPKRKYASSERKPRGWQVKQHQVEISNRSQFTKAKRKMITEGLELAPSSDTKRHPWRNSKKCCDKAPDQNGGISTVPPKRVTVDAWREAQQNRSDVEMSV